MCGIFGAVTFRGEFGEEDRRRFVQQTTVIAHRGPDAAVHLGYDFRAPSPETHGAFNLFLGHRRLAIIDLSAAGVQPMSDGELRLIYNGEIFNYLELRAELEKQGHHFRTATDTEVILKVYRQYGEAGFERLNGMWALALVDFAKGKIILSRDRFSIKPLYYYLSAAGGLYYGSEIKQLLPFLDRRAVNQPAMYQFLAQGLTDYSTETLFAGVLQVPPRYNLVWELATGKLEARPYWDFSPASAIGWDEAVDRFRALLKDSILIRLRSDVKVGALVSGGLDSSAISCIAKDVLGQNLETYSIIADDARYSEEAFIDILVRQGIKNHKLVFHSRDALRRVDEVIYHNDEPLIGFQLVAQFLMLEKIKRETDIVVLLSGQGGDESLCGYHKFFFFYLQELVAKGHVLKACALFLQSLARGTVVRQFKLSESRRYWPKRWQRRPAPYVLAPGERLSVTRSASLRDRQILDFERYSVPMLTHYEDRNSSAHSLESRTPFFDHRLVDLAVNLPPDYKLKGGWSKYILRECIDEVPREIRWRKDKQGFLNPEEHWLKTELVPVIKSSMENSLLAASGIIDPGQFLKHYDRYLSGDRTIWYTEISRVYFAERWMRIFFDATRPEPRN